MPRRLLATIASLLIVCSAPALRAQCNAPPIPSAGATTSWTAARSPFQVCSDLTIPAGATVLVEPGVTLEVRYPATLTVAGTLRANGTAAQPVTFASDNAPAAVVVAGTFEASHAVVRGQIRPDSGSTVVVTDSTFGNFGAIYAPDNTVGWSSPFVRVERCLFDGPGATLAVFHSFLVVRDTQLAGNGLRTGYSYPWLENVTVDGAPASAFSIDHDWQPLYLNRLTARGSARGGLEIGGAHAGNDMLLGPENELTGNAWPVILGDGGLVPGSFVPPAGNDTDMVLVDPFVDPRGPWTWPVTGVPYAVDQNLIRIAGGWTIHPGVEVRLGPGASIGADYGNIRARGTPEAPITFSRRFPGSAWGSLYSAGGDTVFEHVVVDGSANGISAAGSLVQVESSTFQDNGWGVQASGYNPIVVRGSTFRNNDIGAYLGAAGFLDLDGTTNPNSFEGNVEGVTAASADAAGNWWGTSSGPRTPDNPGGTGDTVSAGVPYRPYLRAAPDRTDHPPIVRRTRAHFLAEEGTRHVLRWEASDDRAIVSQRVVFASDGEYDFDTVIAADLPPDQRMLVWTVPHVGALGGCLPSYVRIIATDDAGQEGWDQAEIVVPSGDADFPGRVQITSSFSGTYRPGDRVDVCFEISDMGPALGGVDAVLLLDGDRRAMPLGGLNGSGCLPIGMEIPYVSTDSARVGVRAWGSCNRVIWAFSDCFAIRPDARIPDLPPTLAVTSPVEAAEYAAGSSIPVRWTAADDEALRSFDVLASYDAGRTWDEIVANLPPDATGFDVALPAGETFADLRLRVIARDLRFQDSSNCAVSVSVTERGPDCALDADGDGVGQCEDCAPADSLAWAPPGEDRMLLATSKTTFAWMEPEAPGASVVLHDVLRSRVPGNFGAAAECLQSAVADTAFADAELPGAPGLFAYLVRARNACSIALPGTLGTSSLGLERAGRACP